tara:strand:+ start:8601 stop:9164 length:564 start_codon:yes stop_codon:yes gene_type:complete
MNKNLPFERGATYFDGDTNRATSTGTDHILGQEFTVKNDHGGHGHSVSSEMTLIAIRNGSSGNLSTGKGIRFDPLVAKNLHRICEDYVASQGLYGLAIDDAYGDSYTIVPNDIFYAVLDGPVHIKTALDSVSATITGGVPLTFDASGQVETAAANDHVIGVADVANITTNTNSDLLVWVGRKFASNF